MFVLKLDHLKPRTTFLIYTGYFLNWLQIRELSPNWCSPIERDQCPCSSSSTAWKEHIQVHIVVSFSRRRQIFNARKIVSSWLRTRLRSGRFRRRGLNAASLHLDKIHRQTFQTIVGRNGSSGELSRVLVRRTLGKLTGSEFHAQRMNWWTRDSWKFKRFAVI